MSNLDYHNLNQLWNVTKEEAKQKFSNEMLVYESFLLPSRASMLIDNNLYVFTESAFAKELLNKDYKDRVSEVASKKFNTDINVIFIISGEEKIIKLTKSSDFVTKKGQMSGVNPNFTFDNFIVGKFNSDAYAAANAIVTNPGKMWNPLFIYGGTGLGKSHLLSAIANSFFQKYSNRSVKLVTSESFTREIYESLIKSSEEIEKLKRAYEEVDLLLIDDIQLLAKRDKTNEILFNIFNEFVKSSKHIIMASDKRPEQLEGFEERMRSRFQMGLQVEIKTPEEEIIPYIVEKKINLMSSPFKFSEDGVKYIAKTYRSDIRKLEGALSRIYFYSINYLRNDELITEEVCKKIFDYNNTLFPTTSSKTSPRSVIESICMAYGVSEETIRSNTRLANITKIRQICMYVLREKCDLTYTQIGAEFSGRDHSTVMASIEKIGTLLKTDNDLKVMVEKFIKNV